jgi:hypothetical protein
LNFVPIFSVARGLRFSVCVKGAEEMAVSEDGVGNGLIEDMEGVAGAKERKQPARRKVIIDTDPGIGKKTLIVHSHLN